MRFKDYLFFAAINTKKVIVRTVSTFLLTVLTVFLILSVCFIADMRIAEEQLSLKKYYYENGIKITFTDGIALDNTLTELRSKNLDCVYETILLNYIYIPLISPDTVLNIDVYSYNEFDKPLEIGSTGEKNGVIVSDALYRLLNSDDYYIGDTFYGELLDSVHHRSLLINDELTGVTKGESLSIYLSVNYLLNKHVIPSADLSIQPVKNSSFREISDLYRKITSVTNKESVNISDKFHSYSVTKTITLIVSSVLCLLFTFACFSVITTGVVLSSSEKTGTYRILKLHGLKNMDIYIINLISSTAIILLATATATGLCYAAKNLFLIIYESVFEYSPVVMRLNPVIPIIIFPVIIAYTAIISSFYVKKYCGNLGVHIEEGQNE